MIDAKLSFCQYYCSCHFGAEFKCVGTHIVAGTTWERAVELPSVDEHGTSAPGSAEVAADDDDDDVVESREKANSVSGRCGGVTGVLAGVHIGKWQSEVEFPLQWQHWTCACAAVESWKNMLSAASKCHLADIRSCFACSEWQPATITNLLISSCSRSPSITLKWKHELRKHKKRSDCDWLKFSGKKHDWYSAMLR